MRLRLQNMGTAPVRLGAPEEAFVWAFLSQGTKKIFTQRLRPHGSNGNGWSEALQAGESLELPTIDLAQAQGFAYRKGMTLSKGYPTQPDGASAPTLGPIGLALDPGPVRAKWILIVPRADARVLSLTTGIMELEVPTPDLNALPAKQQEAYTGKLLAQFDRDAWSAQAACRTAAKLGKIAIPSLIRAVFERGRPMHSRMWLTVAIADLRDPRCAEALMRLLHDRAAPVRHVVAYHGPKQRNAALDQAIEQAARDGDPRLTSLATLGFLVYRGEAREELLRQGMGSEDPRARAAAASVMAQYAGADTIDRLVVLLTDRDERVRAAAARALGTMGNQSPRILKAMVDALDLPGETARQRLCDALSSLTGRDVRYDPSADENDRMRILKGWRDWRVSGMRADERRH
jgi:HEAT repeat protein